MDQVIADVVESLRHERAAAVEVADRVIRLVDPVMGDPGLTVLRVLGLAQDASPIGAAARGTTGVAAGVWRSPELYVARWTGGRRWVVGYKLTTGRPNDYVRTEGRPPTRFEIGNWYGPVPDQVNEAFFEAGLLLDDPPFPVPAPPAPARAAAPPPGRHRDASRPSAARTPRSSAPKPPPPGRREVAPTTRLCPSCRMHKSASQFVGGSDLCIDCR